MLTTRQATTALLAVAAGVSMMTPGAFAQSRFQTPDGHQTIGPSEMPQQPSLNEEFSHNANNKVVPNAEPDVPGVPGFVGSKGGALRNPGIIQERQRTPGMAGQQQQSIPSDVGKNTNTAPKSNATAPGGNDQPGALVLPQGESSTVRNGPMEPISPWARAALAFWLLLMFGAMTIIAVALTIAKRQDIDEHDGHLIDADYREPIQPSI
jgi:hypothetical protein